MSSPPELPIIPGTPKSRLLLILACSQRKRRDLAHPLAIDFYDGPLWQTLRTVDYAGAHAQVVVLSALYGLRDVRFEQIADLHYDQIMTRERTDAMIAGGIATRWPRPPRRNLPDTFGIAPAAEIFSMTRAIDGPFDAPVVEIAARLGRSGSGVISRASHLGLRRPNGPVPWHPDEEAMALALAEAGHPYQVIRRRLATQGFPLRSKPSFHAFISRSGYHRGWGRPWIDEECDLLRRAYREGANLVQLAHRMGRGRGTLSEKARQLGLMGSHPKPDGARQGRPWTEADDATLRANYGKGRMKTAELAQLLDRPKLAIYNRAWSLGLDHGYHRDWTPDEDLLIRIAYEAGIPITDLAAALKRDPTIVSKRARKNGISFSGRPGTLPRTPRGERATLKGEDILALARPAGPTGDPWRTFRIVHFFDRR